MTSTAALQPTHGTPRREDRATLGALAALIARDLGQPLDPTQRYIVDTLLELHPEHPGQLAYSRWILALPRRAGKSFLVFVIMLARAVFQLGPQRVWYTAQNGTNITKLWRQEWAPMLEASRLDTWWLFRASQGHEEFISTDKRRPAWVSAFSPKRDALHSQSGDLIVFDECWAHSIELGRELMQAAGPLIATRRAGQVGFASAAGDVDSTWWADLLDMLRTAVALDVGTGVCGFEWTGEQIVADDPERASDPALWLQVHPAAHHGRILTSFLADEYQADPVRFLRQYLNITDRSSVGNTAPIDATAWDAIGLEQAPPLPTIEDAISVGVDCSPEQRTTSITTCRIWNDTPTVELVQHREGWLWAVDYIATLAQTHTVTAVCLDAAGQSPAAVLAGPLEAQGLPVITPNLAGVTGAAARLAADVSEGLIRHVNHPALDDAASAARRRPIGDGAWTFGRLDAGDASPIISAMFATASHPAYDGLVPLIS